MEPATHYEQQPALGFDPLAGEKAKERGMRLAAERRKELLERIRLHLKALARVKPYVSADDAQVFVLLEGHPASALGNAAGSLFANGEWECVGRRKSTRASTHRREIKVWRLK